MNESTAHADEVALAQRAKAGDKQAFTLLVQRYQGAVVGTCRRYLRGADSEDAAQETFVRAFVHLPDFDATRPLLPWLLTIARHLCLDRLRRKKHEPQAELDEAAHAGSGEPSAEQQVVIKQDMQRLQLAIAQLAEGPREALMLYHVSNMPYHEIAAALEVPIGTVMTWLHRGREQLRKILSAPERG